MIKRYDIIVHEKNKNKVYINSDSRGIRLRRQTTNYTCGSSSLSSLLKLWGIKKNEHELSNYMGTKPRVGTCHTRVLEEARKYLKFIISGEDSYSGGIGIANIINPFSGSGHFVILLAKKGNYIRFYCPSIGRIVTAHKKAITWESETGIIKKWSLSIDNTKDVFAIE